MDDSREGTMRAQRIFEIDGDKEENTGPETMVIPYGNAFLAFSFETFSKALDLGRKLIGAPATSHPTEAPESSSVVDAKKMNEMTGIPASWFLEKARQKEIPHLSFGKYVRFNPSDVLSHLKKNGGPRGRMDFLKGE
jgi:hypothetical protein